MGFNVVFTVDLRMNDALNGVPFAYLALLMLLSGVVTALKPVRAEQVRRPE